MGQITIQQAVTVVRDELLKHGDLYEGFFASIKSALNDHGMRCVALKMQMKKSPMKF